MMQGSRGRAGERGYTGYAGYKVLLFVMKFQILFVFFSSKSHMVLLKMIIFLGNSWFSWYLWSSGTRWGKGESKVVYFQVVTILFCKFQVTFGLYQH